MNKPVFESPIEQDISTQHMSEEPSAPPKEYETIDVIPDDNKRLDDEKIDTNHEFSDSNMVTENNNDLEKFPEETTIASVIEAILFASDEPVTITKLVGITEITTKQIKDCIDNLNTKYTEAGHAFRIEKIAGGLQMLTLPKFNYWLRKLLRVRSDTKLSTAALETLAIVAYKQPVIRADIEAIRGVSTGEVLRNLMYKGLVKIIGRAEIVGRPMLYGTTSKFLEVFGLNSLKDLPSIEELKRPPEKPMASPAVESMEDMDNPDMAQEEIDPSPAPEQ